MKKLEPLVIRWAPSKDPDQPGQMPRLIRVFAWRTHILLALSCCGISVHLVLSDGVLIFRLYHREVFSSNLINRNRETLLDRNIGQHDMYQKHTYDVFMHVSFLFCFCFCCLVVILSYSSQLNEFISYFRVGMWYFACLFVFVALRPKSTAMVMAGRSIHLTTLFLGKLEQAVNQ